MGRTQKRAERIRKEIPISRVLSDLGYRVLADAGDREQQFSCDLHGDGTDSKPSARCYPQTNLFYCFACSRARDAVSTIMEKKGLARPDACTYLEKLYGLPPLPWDNWEKPADVGTEIREILNRGETLEILKRRITVILDSLWTEKEHVPLDMYLGLWEQYDRILWHVKTKAWDEERGKSELASLIGIVMASIKGAYEQATADEDTVPGLGGPLDSPTDPH